MVPSLAVTEMRTGRRRSAAPRRIELVLLGLALASFAAAVVIGFIPVDNPRVQSCGAPISSVWTNPNDVVLAAPGSVDAPPDVVALRAQAPCHERLDDRLVIVGLLVVATVALGLIGALVGLADDRSAYRAEPRFETLLRERPAGAPSDPWDQPVIPETDLGQRLPDIEWREVRVVLGAGVGVTLLLMALAGFGRVGHVLGHVHLAWLLVVIVLVVASYGVAAAGILAATAENEDRRRPASVLATAVASSYTGRLLPEYGAAGLAVHQLVRAGVERVRAIGQVAVIDTAAVPLHGILTLVVALVALGQGGGSGSSLHLGWVVWVGIVLTVIVGLIDAPRRYHTLVVAPDRRSLTDLVALSGEPLRLAGIVASCVVLAVAGGCALLATAHTFGASPATAPALLVGLAMAVAVVVSPTPDGAGLVEALAVVGLVWAGVDAPTAVVAMITARVIGFWLPLLPGWLILRRLQRDARSDYLALRSASLPAGAFGIWLSSVQRLGLAASPSWAGRQASLRAPSASGSHRSSGSAWRPRLPTPIRRSGRRRCLRGG